MKTVCDALDTFLRHWEEARSQQSACGQIPGTPRRHLMVVLVGLLVRPGLDMSCFLGCAEALRHISRATDAVSPEELVAQARNAAERCPCRGSGGSHYRTQAAIARIEWFLTDHCRPSERQIADELGVSSAHVGRMLRSETGVGFRSWREALVMRAAARQLGERDEHVARIAYDLGFEPSNVSAFTREFRRLFGLSPRVFRAVARDSTAGLLPGGWRSPIDL